MSKLKRRIWYRALKDPNVIVQVIKARLQKKEYRKSVEGFKNPKSTFQRFPVIYIRTPKCGSSSIYELLGSTDKLIDYKTEKRTYFNLSLDDEVLKKKVVLLYTADISEFSNKFPDVWDAAYKWAIVRNPYSRALSAWRFLENLRDKSFLEVLQNPPQANPDGAYDRDYMHFTKSLSSLLTFKGSLCIDFFLKFESLDEGLKELSENLVLDLPPLPHVNKTLKRKKSKPQHNWTSQEIELVNKLFAKDFENFTYSKK